MIIFQGKYCSVSIIKNVTWKDPTLRGFWAAFNPAMTQGEF